jgi:chromosome segregation ATPase
MKNTNNKTKEQGTKALVPKFEIPELNLTELSDIKTDIAVIEKSVKGLKITDDRTRENAVLFLSQTKTLAKRVKTSKEAITNPIKQMTNFINAEYKKLSDPLDTLEADIKKEQIRDYRVQEEIRIKAEQEARRKEEEARKKLEAELKKAKDDELAQELAKQKFEAKMDKIEEKVEEKQEQKTVSTAFGSATVRMIKKWRIKDENLIPREYFKLDEAKIGTLVRAGGTIAGIEIYEEPSIAGR